MLAAAHAPYLWLALAGFAATGLGLANMLPAAVARAGLLAGSGGVALASTLGYTGLLLGPPAIGFLTSEFGLPAGLSTVSFLALAAAVIAGRSMPGEARAAAGGQELRIPAPPMSAALGTAASTEALFTAAAGVSIDWGLVQPVPHD